MSPTFTLRWRCLAVSAWLMVPLSAYPQTTLTGAIQFATDSTGAFSLNQSCGSTASSAVGARIQRVEGGTFRIVAEVSAPGLHFAALVFSFAHHGGRAGVRISGEFDSRTDLRATRHRIWRSVVHGQLRCGRHPWRIDRSGTTHCRVDSRGVGNGQALFERSGVRAARARQSARAPLSPGCRLPRLRLVSGDELRAAE